VLEPCPVRPTSLGFQLRLVFMYDVSPLSPSSRFCFIYCEMRASNLSLVIATGCYFLWVVGADDIGTAQEASVSQDSSSQGPVNVGITPQILTPRAPYAVTWSGCPGCSSFQVNLVRILTVTVQDPTVIAYPPLTRMYTCLQLLSGRRLCLLL
jgi:hypothetical protein